MTPDTSDITAAGPRLREMNAALSDWDRIRAEGERISREEAYKVLTAEIATLHAKIDRLRLTDAESEAVERAADLIDNKTRGDSSTLRGLLERTQFAIRESDSPQPIECTPDPLSTPDECTVPPQWTSRPYWVDPPSGHRYGFPKLYDPATDGDMVEWMIRNGYPKRLANQGLACTFTHCTEDVKK